MIDLKALPADLAFLEKVFADRNDEYRSADWLKTPFTAPVWECEFGDRLHFEIDYRIYLDDGSLLIDEQHTILHDSLKSWLCVQTHPDATGGLILSLETGYCRVQETIDLIDCFLLNSSSFHLANYGLELITQNDIISLISNLASSSSSTQSIYRWPERLTQFLHHQIVNTDKTEILTIIDRYPFIADIAVDTNERMLSLSDEELIQARALLWKAGLYRREDKASDYIYKPNTANISRIIYVNTLGGKKFKPIPEELCLIPSNDYRREYPAVPVVTKLDNQLYEKKMFGYIRSLRCLGLLEEIGLPVPVAALQALDNVGIYKPLNLKPAGRFRTLPQDVVFFSLRHAIEFFFDYGYDLVRCYLRLVKRAVKLKISCKTYVNKFGIDHLLTRKLRNLGIQSWCLKDYFKSQDNLKIGRKFVRPDKSVYFNNLRANKALWELLKILFGAVQICVGILMARRQGALLDLVAGKCIDSSGTRLVFLNRKSGVVGRRRKIARPIPPVAVKMIRLLEGFQKGLIKRGVIKQYGLLLGFPKCRIGLVKISQISFNQNIDLFCDYFQIPLNNGQRYYIREHQLRRFFAMLFFWSNSFGDMDTLRWFLGHTSIRDLHNYITESTPGEVLLAVKADYASQKVKCHDVQAEDLADLLERHFHTRDFAVLDSVELEEYIEELMQQGEVFIEPEFFNTPDGESYCILIKVTKRGLHEARQTC